MYNHSPREPHQAFIP